MDKTWIGSKSRTSPEYIQGIISFLDFAFKHSAADGRILCPCRRCTNALLKTKKDVTEHLIVNGFLKNYVVWTCHGETSTSSNSNDKVYGVEDETVFDHDINGLLSDVFRMEGIETGGDTVQENDGSHEYSSTKSEKEKEKISNLFKDAAMPLYPNCVESKLATTLYLYHMKCLHGWTNNSFTQLLEYVKFLLPEGNVLPKSHNEVKNMVSSLGLNYEKIHACPNGCMLFWKDKKDLDFCSECGESRWIKPKDGEESTSETSTKNQRPANILRWFPLIPRLQRLFMCSTTATDMRWHDEGRTKDTLLRHPSDSPSWKHLDKLYPEFAKETRNARVGIAADGVNPFKNMNVTHSTWPVIVIPYNLPPWICMKQTNFILSLLISGPKAPGDKMDVYLQPLIDELTELWGQGVETFDASKNETFVLRAAVLWTINDLPAYSTLSGYSTRGEKACPCCGLDTESLWLSKSGKYCYTGHRRWLDKDHQFRTDSKSFYGTQELREAPMRTSGTMLLGKANTTAPAGNKRAQPIKRICIFFQLPYWEHNLLRHNIDFMHTEKNVYDNHFGTITSQVGKTKDNYKARKDLVNLGIRNELHPKISEGGKTEKLTRACYQMTKEEVETFLTVLEKMKLPDELSCNISRGVQVKQRKIIGLKTYDCHVLMQELLPVAIRGCLPKEVALHIIDLCHLFKCLCAKVLKVGDLDKLQARAVMILCEMERMYPPSFFTIMIHLIVHLVEEAKLGGPVFYRWMYPIERFLLTIKNFVRNRAHPEGSIAEGYLAYECLNFCSRYLGGGETRFNRPLRNDLDNLYEDEEPLPCPLGRPLGRKKKPCKYFNVKKRKRIVRRKLDERTLIQAHRYVLFNCEEVDSFRDEHKADIKRKHRSPRLSAYDIEKRHSLTFIDWFREKVAALEKKGSNRITEKIKWLAKGPSDRLVSSTGYIVNGYRFHTKEREMHLKTQNSGVAVISQSNCDHNKEEKNYYGVLKDILKLNYSGMLRIVLFRCDWVEDSKKGCMTDEYGFTLVNFSHLSHTGDNIGDDPFILASQASKVFYIKDHTREGWHVVKRLKVRDAFDLDDVETVRILDQTRAANLEANEASKWLRRDGVYDEILVTSEMINEESNEQYSDDLV